MQEEPLFPILLSHGQKVSKPHPMHIPWSIAELAYSGYATKYGTDQSLKRLSERGGFGPEEMDEYVPNWRELTSELTTLKAEIAKLNTECALKARTCCKFGNKNMRQADKIVSLEAELVAKEEIIKASSELVEFVKTKYKVKTISEFRCTYMMKLAYTLQKQRK